MDQDSEGSHDSGIENVLVEHEADLPLLAQNELFPKENDDSIMSGDSKEFPRDPYSPLHKAAMPLLEEDEQLQLVTAFPAGQETWQEKTTATKATLLGEDEKDAPGRPSASLESSTFTFSDTPDYHQQLSVVDQVLTHETRHQDASELATTEEVDSINQTLREFPSMVMEDLPPAKVTEPIHPTWLQGTIHPLVPHGTASPSVQQPVHTHIPKGHPAISSITHTLTPHWEYPIATTVMPAAFSESTRKSIYTGLNGRYFQQWRDESNVPGDMEGKTAPPTALPVLALAVHKIADNSIEVSARENPSLAQSSDISYSLSNDVEGNSK